MGSIYVTHDPPCFPFSWLMLEAQSSVQNQVEVISFLGFGTSNSPLRLACLVFIIWIYTVFDFLSQIKSLLEEEKKNMKFSCYRLCPLPVIYIFTKIKKDTITYSPCNKPTYIWKQLSPLPSVLSFPIWKFFNLLRPYNWYYVIICIVHLVLSNFFPNSLSSETLKE